MNKEIILLDCFAGIGGFHLAALQAGFKVKASGFSEVCKWKKRVYRYHFPDSIDFGDIKNVKSEDIISQLGGLPDIICGGWPCQDNSIAGLRKGQRAGERSGLIYEFVRLLKKLQPKCFLAENVKGLGLRDSGVELIETIGLFSEVFSNGKQYSVECQLLDSRDWTGQSRQRYYFLGTLGSSSAGMVFPVQRTHTVHVITEPKTGKEIVDCLPASFGKSRWKTESTFLITGDARLRHLSVLEFERFQGFPDSWTAEGMHEKKGKPVKMSISRRYHGLGDAVTVPVVKEIFERLKRLENGL